MDFLNGVYAIATTVPRGVNETAPHRLVAGIAVPDTALAKEARAIAMSDELPEIYNHSLRTYLFSQLIAKAQNQQHDVEAVYVASILHDGGLSPKHMSSKYRFEVDGALVAKELLTRHDVHGSRAELVWDAITLHDSSLAQWKQPEVRLVSQGVNADFGAYLDLMKRDHIVAVLEEAPRHNFIPVFLEAVAAVAKKKPFATGTCFVTDVAYRMVPGFHLDNFCDAVKDNPFAGYGPAGN